MLREGELSGGEVYGEVAGVYLQGAVFVLGIIGALRMVCIIFYVFLVCFEVATGFAGNLGGFFERAFFYGMYVEGDGYLRVINFTELSFEVERYGGGFALRVVPEFAGVVLYAGAVEWERVEEVEVLFYIVDSVATCEGNTNVARAVTIEVSEAGDAEVATVEHVDRLTSFGFLNEIGVVFNGESNVFDYGFKQHVWTPLRRISTHYRVTGKVDASIMAHSSIVCNLKTYELSHKTQAYPLTISESPTDRGYAP